MFSVVNLNIPLNRCSKPFRIKIELNQGKKMNVSKLQISLLKTLVGVMFLSGPVFSTEAGEQKDEKHIPVGNREMSHIEKVKIQERRACLFQKLEQGQDISKEENLQLSPSEQQEVAGEDAQNLEDSKLTTKAFNATTYYTTHEGAFHRPIGVSLLGDAVELEDGSIWGVCSSDRYQTLDWLTGDTLIILPNHDWFSVYNFRLINCNTGANVRVNLSLGPIYNGIFTHWILAIDYVHGEICLEDGSVWKMSSFDSAVVNKWLPNDTLIIGINDGWFSGSNPNILINVNMNNYAMGACVY